MKTNYMIILTILILVTPIIFYVVCFYNTSLSDETSDWGAFGSYIGIGISAISIVLIYITYKEQRDYNCITRFEHHFNYMVSTLRESIGKKEKIIKNDYEKFMAHFNIPNFVFSPEVKLDGVKSVCTYYLPDNVDYDYIFKYLSLIIRDISETDLLKDNEKEGRYTELAYIIPESVRMFYFCWLIQNDSTKLNFCYNNGLFALSDSELDVGFLRYVIKTVCTGIISKNDTKPLAYENMIIDVEDHSQESFFDTYNRLLNDIIE